ncbi:MAG: S-adenosyl-methyltransferase, partial [Actinomycetota bacterium]
LGMGGHSLEMLRRFPELRLIAFDRDPKAIELAKIRLADYLDRVVFVPAEYDQIAASLESNGLSSVDGFLFDLGVSSLQLDDAERGFSYNHDAALDMRMDTTAQLSADVVVNQYSESEITKILREYADEKFAHRIASAIVEKRKVSPIRRTLELAEIVKQAIPAATRRTGGHPAKRTFQAIRIEVNAELQILARAIPAALDYVNLGGRVVVMSYQSLEDRIVKQAFVSATASKAPIDMPVPPAELEAEFKLIVRGAEVPSEAEIAVNPRAASARLRAVERVRMPIGSRA